MLRNPTGPRTTEGKKRASFNALKSGMTAKTVVLPHESATDYHEIRAALIEDYAPATSQEFMLVDQIAAGYWRTIRARRFETAMFDNQLRTKKLAHGKDQSPNSRDDEGCAVISRSDPENSRTTSATTAPSRATTTAPSPRSNDAGSSPPRRRPSGAQSPRASPQDAENLERIVNRPRSRHHRTRYPPEPPFRRTGLRTRAGPLASSSTKAT